MTIVKNLRQLGMAGALLCYSALSHSLVAFNDDFEAASMADPAALSNLGWNVGANVFDQNDQFKFFFGLFGAPNNGGPSWTSLATGEQGVNQGSHYLNTFSVYDCCDLGSPSSIGHGNGTDFVEAFILKEQIIQASDIGSTWRLSYDAKLPNTLPLGPNVETNALIRILDPSTGFSQTAVAINDSNVLGSASWSEGLQLTIDLDDPTLEGQILQVGFSNKSQNFQNTGVYYDNISFTAVPVPAAAWLFISALIGLAGIKRKK